MSFIARSYAITNIQNLPCCSSIALIFACFSIFSKMLSLINCRGKLEAEDSRADPELCRDCRDMLDQIREVQTQTELYNSSNMALRESESSTPDLLSFNVPGYLPKKRLMGAQLDDIGKRCGLCSFFLSALQAKARNFEPGNDYFKELPLPDWRNPHAVHIIEFAIETSSSHVRLVLTIYPIVTSFVLVRAPEIDSLIKPLWQRPASTNRMDLGKVKDWLASCKDSHHECRRGHFRPSRLLDISKRHFVKLKITKDESELEEISYMTLSHCWGKSVSMKLLKSNLKQMQEHIFLNEMSKTFQEAVSVAHSLGSKYLWIDALCIIQDSDEDWNIESALMHRVYSNSECNICATAAVDGSKGLYLDQNSLNMPFAEINFFAEPYYLVREMFWGDNIDDAPLNKRAWVCQERLLSPRNLHFALDGVFWECQEASLCEIFPDGIPAVIQDTARKRLNPNTNGPLIRGKSGLAPDSMLHGYAIWDLIVSTYTKGALTKDSDKLVAISGLAAWIDNYVKDNYLAGLWRTYLPYQLLWRTCIPESSDKPGLFIAPSWSWACIPKGEISQACSIVYADQRDIVVELLHATTHPTGSNKYGSTGGLITLKGRLGRASKLQYHSILDEYVLELDTNKPIILIQLRIWYSWEMRSYNRWGQLSVSRNYTIDNLYFLPIRSEKDMSLKICLVEGLVLLATTDAKYEGNSRSPFIRIGSFKIDKEDSISKFYNLCSEFDKGLKEGLSPDDYEDDGNGGFKYIVTIG